MYAAVDPDGLEHLARICEEAAGDLEHRVAAMSSGLAGADQAASAPGAVREVAADMRATSAELRRRAAAARRDAGGWWAEVWRFLRGGVFDSWNGAGRRSMPWGAWLAGGVRVLRTGRCWMSGRGPVPLFNNGFVGRQLTRVPGMRWFGGPTTSVALRGLRAVGGLYDGVRGTVDLVRQGNPAEAYERKGAGYVSDVAGTAFGYSSAAFMVAPNPVAAGAVVVSGATWLGAEAWDHRDDIVEAWVSAADWTGDRLDDAQQAAAGVADALSFWN